MVLIIAFLISSSCGYYLAFKLTGNRRKSICSAIILGFSGFIPLLFVIILGITIISIIADILKK